MCVVVPLPTDYRASGMNAKEESILTLLHLSVWRQIQKSAADGGAWTSPQTFFFPSQPRQKNVMTLFEWHMNQHEACKSCRDVAGNCLCYASSGSRCSCCCWLRCQVNYSSRKKKKKRSELCCGYLTQFLQEIIVFLFLHNFSLQPHHWHPPTRTSIHPSSLSETRRSQRYQRVSFHESHHQRQLPGFRGNSPL